MGEEANYRWDRRREKTKRRNCDDASTLFGFQIILIIIIFFLFVVGARIFVMAAITTSPCVEAAANYGAFHSGATTFERLRVISIITMIFWLLVSLNFWGALKTLLAKIFHLSLLISLVILQTIFFHLTIANSSLPDGYLNVNSPVVSVVEDIYVYNHRMQDLPEYDVWLTGKETPAEHLQRKWAHTACVWLDDDLISDLSAIRYDSYAAMSPQERFNWSHSRWVHDWQEISLKKMATYSLNLMASEVSMFTFIQQDQFYRPMTLEERQRFITKQACLKSNYGADRYNECSYERFVDWNKYERDVVSKYHNNMHKQQNKNTALERQN